MSTSSLLGHIWRAATDSGVGSGRFPPHWQVPLRAAQDLLLLGTRLMVAKAFFWSGLTKIRDWETTLALFQDEYQVPWLPPQWAALGGTAGELLLPVLLVMGLGGRLAAAGLAVVNAVAVLSLSELAPAAWVQHQLWGALLLGLWFWGPGRIALDHRWFNRSN